ncbi:MAG: glycosyltransferase family 9 protein [Bacteroidia bacterium]|nr:glycosyltransferase family 9 protein [Bacteroidia bacterium]MDW8333147.1 glycosyltransferase family 9 protein [Bacteroidia bacterium]
MKILVVRFSSIGDVVLTTPVLRTLKTAMPQARVDFLVKPAFADAVRHNPRLDRIYVLRPGVEAELRKERYDWTLDLQKNALSTWLTHRLGSRRATFDKQNFKKWRMVQWKTRERVPHVVERYGLALQALGLRLDDGGLEYYPGEQAEQQAQRWLSGERRIKIGMALGARHATKRWPRWSELAALVDERRFAPVLLGGAEDAPTARAFVERCPSAVNAVGKCDLNLSAALLKRCDVAVAPDTGLMHIAAAFGLPIVSIWGNTVPAFGMHPYRTRFVALENDLPCRPCSKLGHRRCPRKHFRCMTLTTPEIVWNAVLQMLETPTCDGPNLCDPGD